MLKKIWGALRRSGAVRDGEGTVDAEKNLGRAPRQGWRSWGCLRGAKDAFQAAGLESPRPPGAFPGLPVLNFLPGGNMVL